MPVVRFCGSVLVPVVHFWGSILGPVVRFGAPFWCCGSFWGSILVPVVRSGAPFWGSILMPVVHFGARFWCLGARFLCRWSVLELHCGTGGPFLGLRFGAGGPFWTRFWFRWSVLGLSLDCLYFVFHHGFVFGSLLWAPWWSVLGLHFGAGGPFWASVLVPVVRLGVSVWLTFMAPSSRLRKYNAQKLEEAFTRTCRAELEVFTFSWLVAAWSIPA